MSSFLYSSAAAKVVPEGSLSPAPTNKKLAMDSPTSPDLVTNPFDQKPSDDLIKPMLNSFDKKIRLNLGLKSSSAAGDNHSPNDAAGGHTNEEDYDKLQRAIGSGDYQASASPKGGLWPKYTELDDRPSSPFVKRMNRECPSPSVEGPEGTQAVREPAYLLEDRPPSASSFKSEKTQAIRDPVYQDTELGINCPSSPPYRNPISSMSVQATREAGYQLPSPASGKPKTQTASEAAPLEESWQVDEKLSGWMKESYRSPAREKLPSVVEESESFSRREFGADGLLYMSTHSSANHAANFAMHSSYNHSNFSSKLSSYHHNNRPNVSLRTHSSYPPNNFTNCKSAPAGSAARTRSTFAMFRRGSSEGGKLGGRVVYQSQKPRRSRSLGHTLLWPLVKIKNGYVGCMMGLEGTGDLSGMAQGGSYATRARYFADIPLSKSDSRNHG